RKILQKIFCKPFRWLGWHAHLYCRRRRLRILSAVTLFLLTKETGAAHRTCSSPRFRLVAGAGVSGKRVVAVESLKDGAEIDRFWIKRFVFRDLRPVQNLEAVTFEHFFTAPPLERDDLAIDALFA